jgi:hypothetical protein
MINYQWLTLSTIESSNKNQNYQNDNIYHFDNFFAVF